MSLTQPELQQLRENLSAEMLMIQKYSTYAQQVNDPQLKQVCTNILRTHERHRDMLMRQLNRT